MTSQTCRGDAWPVKHQVWSRPLARSAALVVAVAIVAALAITYRSQVTTREMAEDALRAQRIEFYPTRLACEDGAASNRRMRDPYHG